jgi:hypothetical protein
LRSSKAASIFSTEARSTAPQTPHPADDLATEIRQQVFQEHQDQHLVFDKENSRASQWNTHCRVFAHGDALSGLGGKRRKQRTSSPGALWLHKARERLRSEIFDFEQGADLPPRAISDDHCARRRQCLQPRRKSWRLADDVALPHRALPDQVADDDKATGNAKPHAQLC